MIKIKVFLPIGGGSTNTYYIKIMKIHGIADEGKFKGDEAIRNRGAWGQFKFPPFFKTRELAEDFIKENELIHRIVVELELED